MSWLLALLLLQNFPQPGPGIPGFWQGIIYPSEVADFDAASDEAGTIVDNATLSLGADTAWTLAAWIDAESYTNFGIIASKRTGAGAGNEYGISFQDADTEIQCMVSDGGTLTSHTHTGAAGSALLRLFVACTHDPTANELNAYVNGSFDGSPTSYSGGTLDGGGTFWVGAAETGTNSFDGKVGPVAVWNGTALSDAQLDGVYFAGEGLPCANISPTPTACWNMDGTSGDYADSIGSLDLTRVNTPGNGTALIPAP